MEIDWIKYGFEESEILRGEFTRKDFPFTLMIREGCLAVMWREQNGAGDEVYFGRGIPATNQAVVLLLKAFNVPKNP